MRQDLALEAVADAEQIEVADEMVEAWIREQAADGREDADAAVERLMADAAMLTALRIDLRLQKALDIAVDNAKEITPEQAEAAPSCGRRRRNPTTRAVNPQRSGRPARASRLRVRRTREPTGPDGHRADVPR